MARDNDATDRRLLALLQTNARASVATLARKLGVARTTVQERITRMERNGRSPDIPSSCAATRSTSMLKSWCSSEPPIARAKLVVEKLQEFPEVVLCQVTSGDLELICRIRVPHMEDVQPVLDSIDEIAGIERVRSIVVLSTAFDHSHAEPQTLATKQATALGRGELG
jgi:DNA-binding Lrp family transcriptional regulator